MSETHNSSRSPPDHLSTNGDSQAQNGAIEATQTNSQAQNGAIEATQTDAQTLKGANGSEKYESCDIVAKENERYNDKKVTFIY